MPFQVLRCEDCAWISICPFKALIEVSWEALQESCTIAAPDLAAVVDQPSLQIYGIVPMILAYTSSTLAWFGCSNYATFHPHLWYVRRGSLAIYTPHDRKRVKQGLNYAKSAPRLPGLGHPQNYARFKGGKTKQLYQRMVGWFRLMVMVMVMADG